MGRIITAFSSDKQDLSDLLKQLHEGDMQLSDFQRGWVWNDAHIVSLLASIGLSYPIGPIMTLETGNPDVRFQTRAVEGVRRVLAVAARTPYPRRTAAAHLALPGVV